MSHKIGKFIFFLEPLQIGRPMIMYIFTTHVYHSSVMYHPLLLDIINKYSYHVEHIFLIIERKRSSGFRGRFRYVILRKVNVNDCPTMVGKLATKG